MYILFQAIAFASESALTDTGEYQMKLSRQSTSEHDRSDRDNSFSGKVAAKYLLRGNKHHFLIENATAAELEAMDALLSETTFASCCDACPNYNQGYSRGWWIAIEDVPAFKAEYKRLKGLVAERIEQKKAEAVDEALAAMTFNDVAIVARIAYNVRIDLLTDGSTVNSLRNPDYFTPSANPFHRGRNVLTADLWALVAQCLIIGKNETCASLHILEKKANAEVKRRHEADEPRRVAEVIRAEFWLGNPVRQREDLELAKALARKIDRLIGNADQLPEFGRKYGLSPDDFDFVLLQTERLHPGMLAADIEAAHGEALAVNSALDHSLPEFSTPALQHFWPGHTAGLKMLIINAAHAAALEENDEFDGIIRDGLTPEQRAIECKRMGTDVYAEGYMARQYDEAMEEDDRWHWLEARHWVFWKDTIPAHQREELSAAHEEALAINYVLDAMPDGAGSLNGYVVQHAKGTFHKVCESNRTYNPLQASYFSPEDHQQGRMKQFCMNGEKIVRLGDACRAVAGHAKSPIHQPHKKE